MQVLCTSQNMGTMSSERLPHQRIVPGKYYTQLSISLKILIIFSKFIISYPPSIAPTLLPSTVTPSMTPTYYPSLSPHSISIITTIVGTGTGSYSGDGGQATSATINTPTGIVIDASGNVYFSEWSNNRVRKITVSTGIISTFAGTGTGTYSGDGGVASSAKLNRPDGLCIDTSGKDNILKSMSLLVRILKYFSVRPFIHRRFQ